MRQLGQGADDTDGDSVIALVDSDHFQVERDGEIASVVGRGLLRAPSESSLLSTRAERIAAVVLPVPSMLAEPAEDQPGLPKDLLFRLIAAGARTIGYGDGLAGLPLEQRCLFLLSGVEILLDSASPDFLEDLRRVVGAARVRHSGRRDEQSRLRNVLDDMGIVAQSVAMRSALGRLVHLAEVGPVPVLLQGETGTGKEIGARVLHSRDPTRRSGPFVAVNCAALPKSLAESELFGHRRGAYSGATQDRLGLIRAAEGGVLFLDEIGELDWELQGKLLRVVQERRVLPVGDEREVPIDVRIVSASHQRLSDLVEAGRFRQDLFYRLSVVCVQLPPLRERLDDIGPLARHFVERHVDLHGGVRPGLAPEFLDALARMRFPGNVRQLENLIRVSLAALDHAGPLTLRELPRSALEEVVARPSSVLPAVSEATSPVRTNAVNLAAAVDAYERSLIASALAKCNGSQTAAAKLLGVTPRTVFNKIHRHGLERRATRPPPSDAYPMHDRRRESRG